MCTLMSSIECRHLCNQKKKKKCTYAIVLSCPRLSGWSGTGRGCWSAAWRAHPCSLRPVRPFVVAVRAEPPPLPGLCGGAGVVKQPLSVCPGKIQAPRWRLQFLSRLSLHLTHSRLSLTLRHPHCQRRETCAEVSLV